MQNKSDAHTDRGNRPVTLDDLAEFFQGVIVPYMAEEFAKVNARMDEGFGKVNSHLDKVEDRLGLAEERLAKVETDLLYVKNDVRDLKADMPTKEEFEVVRKLEKLHRRELAALAVAA